MGTLGMRQLNGVYTQARNKRYSKTGHLFQGRYRAILIQKDTHLLEVCRYVVLNPVRARMVEKPEDWRWSSYRATGGKETAHPCLTTDWVLGQFSRTRGKAESIPETPKSQRYANRPPLEKIFSQSILDDRRKRDRTIARAVEKYGYTQRSIADHLGVHATYISRILCGHYRR